MKQEFHVTFEQAKTLKKIGYPKKARYAGYSNKGQFYSYDELMADGHYTDSEAWSTLGDMVHYVAPNLYEVRDWLAKKGIDILPSRIVDKTTNKFTDRYIAKCILDSCGWCPTPPTSTYYDAMKAGIEWAIEYLSNKNQK